VRRVLLLVLALASCGTGRPDGTVPPATLTEGYAAVEVTGDMKRAFTATLDPDAPNVYTPPDGGFALNWADDRGDGLGIGGPLFTGSRATSEAMSLSLSVRDEPVPVVFVDLDGSCQVTVEAAEGERFEGSFACEELSAADGTTIDAEGTFTAGK
jgi:hypothetical protein